MDIKELPFSFLEFPTLDDAEQEEELREEIQEAFQQVADHKVREDMLQKQIEKVAGPLYEQMENEGKMRSAIQSEIKAAIIEYARRSGWNLKGVKAKVGNIPISISQPKPKYKVNNSVALQHPGLLDALESMSYAGASAVHRAINLEIVQKLVAKGDISEEQYREMFELGILEEDKPSCSFRISIPK